MSQFQFDKTFAGLALSSDTLNSDTLADMYRSFIKSAAPEYWAHLVESQPELLDGDVDVELEILEEALDVAAPEGCYFGAHYGDGACFGFWELEDEK